MQGISDKAAGGLISRYKYSNKEQQNQEFEDGSGLEEYDFEARFYENQIGRWNCIDPLSEKYYSLSPYNYVLNNPILQIDPNGMEIFNAWEIDRRSKQQSIDNVQSTINDPNTSKTDKEVAQNILRSLLSELDEININLKRTDEVISDLKGADISLFNELNNLTDANGDKVDVYLKTINSFGEETGVYGDNSIASLSSNPNKPTSAYDQYSNGRGTVLVRVNSRRYGSEDAVVLTAHELGHVKYNVPHLASYIKFFKENYDPNVPGEKGHRSDDPSGKSVDRVLKEFMPLYKQYKKSKK